MGRATRQGYTPAQWRHKRAVEERRRKIGVALADITSLGVLLFLVGLAVYVAWGLREAVMVVAP